MGSRDHLLDDIQSDPWQAAKDVVGYKDAKITDTNSPDHAWYSPFTGPSIMDGVEEPLIPSQPSVPAGGFGGTGTVETSWEPPGKIYSD
jgi:hypothetical protein